LQARLETDTCFRELVSGANLCFDDLGFPVADRTATFEALLWSFLHNLIHFVLIMILEMQGHEQKTAFVLLGYNDDSQNSHIQRCCCGVCSANLIHCELIPNCGNAGTCAGDWICAC
jgi:hypothetical protein